MDVKNNRLKTCAVINDLSGFGRCALTVALPVISALGLRACPMPTAILSNHTGFDDYFFSDFTDSMRAYYEKWELLGLRFDGIYTGFLGSVKQVELILDFIDRFKRDDTLLFVDPVMGDHGELYSTYTMELCEKMRALTGRADVLTPNLTEACFLTGTSYALARDGDDEVIFGLCDKLCADGAGICVITGIRRGGRVRNFIADRLHGDRFFTESEYVGGDYCGTGDLFASLLCGYLVRGIPLRDALARATAFLRDAVAASYADGVSPLDGIAFEPILYKLTERKELD